MSNYKYKPLLFTTTMRNPERLKGFLSVLNEYDGQTLNNELINTVSIKLIKEGLYKPTKASTEVKDKWKNELELTNAEAEKVFNDNPQSHKEAGFDRGWPSRFDTWFKIAKELGFVWYKQDELITFSDSGKMLLDKEKPENETMVFANSFAKYQRNNPFRRVLNLNTPLVLLFQVIQLLNKDPKYNGAGISKAEIPVLLCWKTDDAQALYEAIKVLREKHGFTPSNETILDICYSLLDDTKRDDESILTDYPDDFIRKMRLTGLISLRGGGRFVDINTKEITAIEYILGAYKELKEFVSEEEFFKYIGTIDKELVSKLSAYNTRVRTSNKELVKWVEYYAWDAIKVELLNLAQKRASKDEILKVIEQPLRLEFLTSLAIMKRLPEVMVKPNFVSDDEGLPTSFAAGGTPDIECVEKADTALIEVTLLTGTQQHIRESFSVHRHLEQYVKNGVNAYSVFISPKVFVDTARYASFIKKDGLDVRILDIDQFVERLEVNNTLQETTLC